MLTILLAAGLLGQGSIDCTTIANMTHCDTRRGSTPPAPQVPYSDLLNAGRDTANAFGTQGRAAPALDGAQRAEERRREVYLQVGSLIAAGKCAEANRLAAFHGQPVLIADTLKACPN